MFKRIYSHFTNNETAPLHWVDQMLFWIGAVLVSVAAILFAKISAIGNNFFLSVITDYPALGVIACPIGFGLIVWLTRRFFVGAEGSGIPQVIAAIDAPEIANRASVLSLRVAIGKVLLTTIGLCFGASVGREGPTVQIGAAIMHKMGKLRSLPPYQIRRALILAGGAAGIAAAFNTPLAGILFAIEELSRSFEEKTSGTVLTTVIVSGFVSMAVLGNYTYFGSTDVVLGLVEAWKPVLICGVLGGVLGGLFSKLLILFSQTLPGRIGQMIGEHPVWFAGFCGLGVGLLGFCSVSSIYGTGYQEAKSLLEGDSHLPIWYGPLKLLATVLSYISGLPGGFFAPSLAVGAGVGGQIAPFLPDVPFAAVVILGMVGYFSGVVQVPITATIIVLEMTNDQSLSLPLLATAFIAFAVSRLICPSPLYRSLAQSFLDHASRHSVRTETTPPVLS